MKKLYEFFWDCGRMGSLEGLFIADEATVAKVIGKKIYFGEVLGKHSEISGIFGEEDIQVISDEQERIDWLEGLVGTSVSGFNPLDYLSEDEEGDE